MVGVVPDQLRNIVAKCVGDPKPDARATSTIERRVSVSNVLALKSRRSSTYLPGVIPVAPRKALRKADWLRPAVCASTLEVGLTARSASIRSTTRSRAAGLIHASPGRDGSPPKRRPIARQSATHKISVAAVDPCPARFAARWRTTADIFASRSDRPRRKALAAIPRYATVRNEGAIARTTSPIPTSTSIPASSLPSTAAGINVTAPRVLVAYQTMFAFRMMDMASYRRRHHPAKPRRDGNAVVGWSERLGMLEPTGRSGRHFATAS